MASNQKKIIMGILVLILCILLGYNTVSNYMIQYSTIEEIVDGSASGKDMHIAGTIEPGSFSHIQNSTYTFILIDETATVEVIYKGSLPPALSEKTEIVIVGNMKNDIFEAKKLIASCPSKFTE